MAFKKGNTPHNKGKCHSDETKKKMRDAHKGRIYTLSDSAREKLSRLCIERHLGKKTPEEVKRKLSEAMKKRKLSDEHKRKIGESNRRRKLSIESRIKSSCTQRGIPIEEFDKFVKYDDYCEKFNEPFKERVREFFGRRCVECGKSEANNVKKLSVHHVIYDKGTCCNSDKPLFVALCSNCHAKTNHNREYWKRRFIEIIHIQYGGKCYFPKPHST